MATATEILKAKGLRATPKRIALLAALESAGTPLTAEEVHAKVRDTDLVTVYRNLQSLAAAGLAREVRFKDSAVRYEFAQSGRHHHHLVCTSCNAIDELPACDLGALETQALRRSGRFASIDEHALEFFGTCRICARG